MSKYTSNRSGGNDGSWFLEAIGESKAPTGADAVAELEAENTTVEELAAVAAAPEAASATVEMQSFDGDPGTSTSSFDPIPVPPPPPPTATSEFDRLEDLPAPAVVVDDDDEPEEDLAPVVRSKRNFRWPVVVGLLIAIALVALAAVWVPQYVDDQALEVRRSYYDAAFEVRDYLPTAQSALDVVTNPATSGDEVSSAVPVIAEFDSRAFALESVTAEPLPTAPPLMSDPIDALEPLRATGAILGSASSDVAGGIGTAYVYRTSVPLLLDYGQLPIAATTQEVNEISVRLASTLASDAGIVADLPDSPAFAEVRTAAVAAIEFAADWQDRYLTALTGEDQDAAADLVNEIEAVRTELNALNESALVAFRTDADLAIVGLAGELDAYLVALTQN